jgi:RND family efflux transporter MFP subunit
MRIITLFCLLALISCQNDALEKELKTVTPTAAENLPLVSVHKITKQVFNHFHKIQGSIVSKNMAYIRPEINGPVKELYVKEGDYVKKNQKLITLSVDLLSSQLSELEQQLSFVTFLYEKQLSLYSEGVTTEIQLKEAENNVENLKNSRATLLTQIEKSTLYAPFEGYIESSMVQLGEAVSPINPIFHLVGVKDLYVAADVSENLLSEIKINNPVIAYFPSINETIEDLKLTRLGKLVNLANRTVKIEAKLPENYQDLIPNLMGEVSINDYRNDTAICLFSRLILKDADGKTFVKSLNSENKVVIIPIKIGKQQGDLVEVLTPISEGTQIIDRGKSTVLEGQKVKIISVKNS